MVRVVRPCRTIFESSAGRMYIEILAFRRCFVDIPLTKHSAGDILILKYGPHLIKTLNSIPLP